MLNREGLTRLCYCGPVLHTRPSGLQATREPLQFGAETYGHAGLEADLEIQDVALDCLRSAGIARVTMDLGDARIVRGLLDGVAVDAARLASLVGALAVKDLASLDELSQGLPDAARKGLRALLRLYGGMDVLVAAERELPQRPLIAAAIADLRWLASHVAQAHPEAKVGFDLADLGGNAYYSGARFAVYAEGSSDAIAGTARSSPARGWCSAAIAPQSASASTSRNSPHWSRRTA